MKQILSAMKQSVTEWIAGKGGRAVVATSMLVLGVFLLGLVIGLIVGHASGSVVQIFEQSAYGLSGALTAAMVKLQMLAGNIGFSATGASMAMATAIVAGTPDAHIDAQPLTLKSAEEHSPGLVTSEIDRRIVKIRPMATPLDQISRCGLLRKAGSMKVEYYSVDTKPGSAKVKYLVEAGNDRDTQDSVVTVQTDRDEIFQPTTTIIVPSVEGKDGLPLVLYVVSNEGKGEGFKVRPVNTPNASGANIMPKLAVGTELVRMGRAASELDVMTAQYEALPVKRFNYCQIFKAQVEQSTLMKIANKEVGWTFSDQEEAAIIDMRMGMEKNFLFGHMTRFTDSTKGEEVMLTGGIWGQAGSEFEYQEDGDIDEAWLVSLCRKAFTSNAGSSRKVLLGGSGLIEKLHSCGAQRVMQADKAVTKWGLDFTEIHSKFGTLYVMLAEVFDQCGMPDHGMVIDPEYITKYAHVPFRSEKLNLRQSGVRNVDAIVITEASCLVLRYPQSHLRIVAKPGKATA